MMSVIAFAAGYFAHKYQDDIVKGFKDLIAAVKR